MKYVEITCARMVEFLRAIRDAYRTYLKEQGAKPLAEMYWVVCRCGVKDWAVMVLREAVFEYIRHCQIRSKDWDALFEFPSPPESLLRESQNDPLWEPQNKRLPPTVHADTALSKRIGELVDRDVFDDGWTGGPFGRDGQIELARSMFGMTLLTGPVTLSETFDRRQDLWDKCYPWTEGLAMLFDAAQEELFFQFDALGDDGRRAESLLLTLSPLQKILHKHTLGLRPGGGSTRSLGDDFWLPLFRELDENGILPDELTGNAKKVLTSVRKQRKPAGTFVECYQSKGSASLEDGKKPHPLRREVCHAIHGEVQKAKAQFAKIYPMPKRAESARIPQT
jgi:hypothetical protein